MLDGYPFFFQMKERKNLQTIRPKKRAYIW